MDLIVQKYGGTSVATIERIQAVAEHIQRTVDKGSQVVVVVSAMGQQTDELLNLALQVSKNPPRRELDMLLTVGERISMSLLSIALHERGLPSLSLTGSQSGILTDDVHGNARIKSVLGDRIKAGLSQKNVIIIAGFQGMSANSKEITTLGRGGSDLTAVALAHVLKAKSCEIYKDVDGVFTADPHVVSDARIVRQLDWQTMSEICWGGASVIHARALSLAQKYQIRLEVRSSFSLDRAGTVIFGSKPMESMQVTAIAEKTAMGVAQFEFSAATNPQAVVTEAMQWLWQNGEVPLLSTMVRLDGTTDRITFIVRYDLTTGLGDHLKKFATTSGFTHKATKCFGDLSCLTIAGSGFWQNPELVTQITETIGAVNIAAMDVKNNGVIVCVSQKLAKNIQRQLHDKFMQKT